MNLRSTYILMAGGLVLLVGLAIYVFFFADSTPTGKGYLLEGMVASGYKPEDITTLEIEKSGSSPEKLLFIRDAKGKEWKLTEPIKARVYSYQVDNIIREILAAKRETKGVEIRNLATHQLDPPTVKVTLKKGGERSGTLSLGTVTIGDRDRALVYLLSSDHSNKILVTKKSNLSNLFKTGPEVDSPDTAGLVKSVTDFRQTRLLEEVTDSVNQTQSVKIKRGKEELALQRDSDGVWRFTQPPGFGEVEVGENTPASPSTPPANNLRTLLNSIYDLQVANSTDYIDNLKSEDLAKMGIIDKDNPDVLQIQIDRRVMSNENPISTQTVYVGKLVEGTPDKYYARVAGDNSVAKINGTPVANILRMLGNPKSLRNRDLVRFETNRADAVDVDVGGVKFELRKPSAFGGWNVYDPKGNLFQGNTDAIRQLLEAFARKNQVIDFPPVGFPDNQLGLDDKSKVAEVKIWLDGIAPPEKVEPKKEDTKKDDAKKDELKKEETKKEDTKKGEAKKEEPKKDEGPRSAGSTKPKLKGEANIRIIFGKESGEGIYVRRIDASGKIDVLVPKSLFSLVVKRPYLDYIDPALTPFMIPEVVKLQFNRGKESFELAKEGTSWKIILPEAKKGRIADDAKINGILTQLSGLKPARVAIDTPTPEDFKKFKVDPSDNVMKVVVMLKDGKERQYYFGTETTDKLNVYGKVPEQPFLFEVPSIVLEPLRQGDFVDPIVYRVDRSKLKTLKLSGWLNEGGEVLTRELEQKDGKWSFKTPLKYDLDTAKLENFLLDILAPRAEQFVITKGSPTPEQKLDINKGALLIEMTTEDGKTTTLLLGAPDPSGTKIFAQTNQLPGDVFTLLRDPLKTVLDKPAVFRKE